MSSSTADTAVQAAPVVLAIAADSCASCGVRLAADQRYCVECGHPRGAARLPVAAVADPGDEVTPVAGSPPRAGPTAGLRGTSAWRSPNATVFAVVGSLLLALGIGVLIGRSDSGMPANGPQRVTVVLSGSGAAAGAVAPTPAASVAATGATGTTASSAGSSTAKKTAAKTPVKARTAPPKAVKVGSSGTGPGYQGGKFTGNFFGGGG